MEKKEVEQLKNWCKTFLKDDFDTFDFDSEIDRKLTIGENKSLLREKIRKFINTTLIPESKRQAEVMSKEQVEVLTTEVKHKQEEQASCQ